MIYTDDISGLNKTIIKQIVYPKDTIDCVNIIRYAIKHNLTIIPRGAAHSMGGQTIANNGLIVDTKYMNNILNLDTNNNLLTVQPGALWSDVIAYLDNYGLSPKTLQSYSSFSIGGTLSVNAHGITSDLAMSESVTSITLVNGDMNIVTCSRYNNHELFSLVLGGYGLFGIITQVTIMVVPNVKLDTKILKLNTLNFNKVYQLLLCDTNVSVKFARINITNMTDITLYVFKKIAYSEYTKSRLAKNPNQMSKLNQLLYKWMLPNPQVQRFRYYIEDLFGKPLDAKVNDQIALTRNQLVYESADALANLYSPVFELNKTHILQEYFIPPDKFIQWMNYLKYMFVDSCKLSLYMFNKYSLLNITIRYIKKDKTTFLKYATKDMFAFVFYYRISATPEMDKYLRYIHETLTNYALHLGGTFYLPYRHHYNKTQLIKAYPNIIEFLAMKQLYDPRNLFANQWLNNLRKLL